MKKILSLLAFFSLSIAAALAETPNDAQQHFEQMLARENIFAGTTPFDMEVEFVLPDNKAIQGRLHWQWISQNRWRREVELPSVGFHQIEVRRDDSFAAYPSPITTPVQIRQLTSMLQALSPEQQLVVKNSRQRRIKNIEQECFDIKADKHDSAHEKICANVASGTIASIEETFKDDEPLTFQFAEELKLGAKRFPKKLQTYIGKKLNIEAHIKKLEVDQFDESILNTPDRATIRRACENMTAPVPLYSPDPSFPQPHSSVETHQVELAATLTQEGVISAVAVLQTSSPAYSKTAIEAIKKWKFKPAYCGSEPVTKDIRISVAFR